MTETFSHELAEILTDPDNNGVTTAPGPNFNSSIGSTENPGEIGDNEGEFYIGFENGSAVQAYWSAQGSDYVVPGGTLGKVALKGAALSVAGDRLGISADDSLVIDTTGAGGVQVTLNGETEQFAPGQVNQINVSLGGGTNAVRLDSLPPGVSISIDGSGGVTTLTAPDGSNDWQVTGPGAGTLDGVVSFSSIQSLAGGAGQDRFAFQPGGSIPGNVDGGGGVNTLDYSALAGPVVVDLQASTAPGVGGTFSNIGDFVGSASAADTLVGPDATWDITGANAGSVNGSTFSSFENLTGGAGPDQFIFQPGGSVSGNIDGGGGDNTLDYSALAGPVTVNLQTSAAPGVGGVFSNIDNFVGSGGSDTLVGPDASSVWDLTGPNAGTVTGVGFSSFENLTGGGGDDRFVFLPGGGVAGNVDGGGGSNTLDYSNLTTPVTLNLQNDTATGIGGTFSHITNFVAGSGPNTLVGPDADTVWTLSGLNTISVNGLSFSGFQSLAGGSGADRFVFQSGGGVSGSIDGGGGNNTLDYSPFVGNITVNLALGTATGVGDGISRVENVTGSIGDDLLVGDAQANTLLGGTGRSVIIGGAGADRLAGGGGDNILIGGTTAYDTSPTALAAIMAEWSRTDLSFEKRLADLISSAPPSRALNGPYGLNKKTVFDDGAANVLTGGGGSDWFFTGQDDTVVNRKPKDHVTGE
jgi:Ca2+-binding RTX toxin-like protein